MQLNSPLQNLWGRNKCAVDGPSAMRCPSPVPQRCSSSPTPAHCAGLGTGSRTGEVCARERGWNVCLSKVFTFHNPWVRQRGGLPRKTCHCQHSCNTNWSWQIQSNGIERKLNLTTQACAWLRQQCKIQSELVNITLAGNFFFLHLNEKLTNILNLLTKKPATFSSKLLPHSFLLFWKSLWTDKLRIEQPHLT